MCEKLAHCFYEARCCQLYYSQCIEESCSDDERVFFQELALQSTNQAKFINEFAQENYGMKFLA